MTHLRPGEPAPWFFAPTTTNPGFSFASVAGRYILMGFLPADPAARGPAFEAVQRNLDILRDDNVAAFLVLRDPESFARARDRNGLRWFFDPAGEVARLYGSQAADATDTPIWVLIDPSLRVMLTAPIGEVEQIFARLRALPSPDDHAGVTLHAPVMITPRLFDDDLCRRLIAYYDAQGGEVSGVMREVDGRTVGVVDDFKSRRDAIIWDEALQNETRRQLYRNLIPEILKAFRFKATRIERYIVARYDADEGGYFRAHRDNLTAGTAHRQFACSINLNAEDFEGGDLRFPEYGMRTYRPPTGGAVVFSCSLLHEATRVTRGRRYAFLPFFFDEAGEELRLRNLHLVDKSPQAPGGADDRSEPDAGPQAGVEPALNLG